MIGYPQHNKRIEIS